MGSHSQDTLAQRSWRYLWCSHAITVSALLPSQWLMYLYWQGCACEPHRESQPEEWLCFSPRLWQGFYERCWAFPDSHHWHMDGFSVCSCGSGHGFPGYRLFLHVLGDGNIQSSELLLCCRRKWLSSLHPIEVQHGAPGGKGPYFIHLDFLSC